MAIFFTMHWIKWQFKCDNISKSFNPEDLSSIFTFIKHQKGDTKKKCVHKKNLTFDNEAFNLRLSTHWNNDKTVSNIKWQNKILILSFVMCNYIYNKKKIITQNINKWRNNNFISKLKKKKVFNIFSFLSFWRYFFLFFHPQKKNSCSNFRHNLRLFLEFNLRMEAHMKNILNTWRNAFHSIFASCVLLFLRWRKSMKHVKAYSHIRRSWCSYFLFYTYAFL